MGKSGLHLKRLFVFLIFFAFFSSSLKADVVPLWTAKEVANNYIYHCISLRGTWAGTKNPVIIGIKPVIYNNEFLGYSFSVYPKGHLLVPFHDEFSPVLLYSETSGFDPEKAYQPGSIESWIIPELYNSLDIVQKRKNSPALRSAYSSSRVAMAWDRFSNNNASSSFRLDTTSATVDPLLETSWDQGSPYNLYCPSAAGCTNTLVGCVGLAWAQVMNYWEWPDRGTGSHSYPWNTEQLSSDFNTTYSWTDMPDQLTASNTLKQKESVARLCYDTAIAAETDFGCRASDSLPFANEVLPVYFKYKISALQYSRCDEYGENCYSDAEWFDFIKDELDEDPPRPVIFSIYVADGNGGHETVIDGYREGITDKVHINFGWNGGYNGYYDITHNFNASFLWDSSTQVIVTRLEPDLLQAAVDTDNDTVFDISDNCPDTANTDQADNDTDGRGDVCDNCPGTPNGPDRGTCTSGKIDTICTEDSDCGLFGFCSMNQEDADTDGTGNTCDDMKFCPAVTVLGKNDPGLDTIRSFRDRILSKSASGKKLIEVYYRNGKKLSEMIEHNRKLKEFLEIMLNGLIPVMDRYLESDS